MEARLAQQKKEATGLMVQEAVVRDTEAAEKEAVNEHDSDGALENMEDGGIPIDDDEAYIASEVAYE